MDLILFSFKPDHLVGLFLYKNFQFSHIRNMRKDNEFVFYKNIDEKETAINSFVKKEEKNENGK